MKAVFMTGDEKNLAGVYKTVREKLTAELDFPDNERGSA